MNKLDYLRGRLAQLRLRRRLLRCGLALAALGLTLLTLFAAVFAVDWFFDMNRLQRAITFVLAAGTLYWAYRRWAQPWLAIRETDIDVALLVERQQEIDGDLVAALQFEEPEAQQWGSAQLRHAVVDYVATFSKGVNVLEGFSSAMLVRRLALFGAALGVAVLLGVFHPDYLQAFVNRLCLGSERYPTRTRLVEVAINGVAVPLTTGNTVVVRSPYGVPLLVTAQGAGALPEEGTLVVQPITGQGRSTVALARGEDDSATYTAPLPELVDAIELEVLLGDTRSDAIRVEVIPLPVIETQATVTVPEYARYAALAADAPRNSRQLTVVEGSRVDLEVQCSNKRLQEAVLRIDGVNYPLQPVQVDGAERWTLAGTASPLSAVAQPLRYEVQVSDEDGLKLAQPLQGAVRIKADQRPQIVGGALTRFVLPTARPPIYYRAADDYGISKLVAHVDIVRKEGESEMRRTLPVQTLSRPLLREQLPLKGQFALDLPSLRLLKGDRLTVTLEVLDYRGTASGLTGLSEGMVFQITDEAGILEDIAKPDYQSAEELDAIIRQQLNIGGAK